MVSKDIFSDENLDRIDTAIDKTISKRIFGVGETVAGRYKVERVVGRGNYSHVYRVVDAQNGKKRALKIFYERLTERPGVSDALQKLGEHLRDAKHPNLVKVYEVDVDGPLMFFVEEFVSALTLERVVRAVATEPLERGFPLDQMTEIITQTCAVLDDLPGLFHLGLNPHNVFASKAGVKIADFGVAGVLRPALDEKDLSVLSGRTFMAPEFYKKMESSPASDVYSLGRLLEYMLTLSLPKIGVEPMYVRGGHPRALLDLARGSCDIDPDLRPPSAGAFLGAFEAARQASVAEEPETMAAEEARLAEAARRADEGLSVVAAKPAGERLPLHEIDHAAETEFFGEPLPVADQPGSLPTIEAMPPLPGEARAKAKVAAPPLVLRPRAKRKKSVGTWAAVIVLVLLGALAFAFRDRIFSIPESPARPTPVHDANSFELEGVTIQPEPGGPTFEEMIDALLLQAQQYVDTNHIIDPPDECALANYSLILDLDPKNQKARDGIAALEQRYLALGRAFVTARNVRRATWAFQSVLKVNKDNREAREQLAGLARLAPERTPVEVAGGGGGTGPEATPEGGGPEATPQPTGPLGQITAGVISSTVNRYMGRVRFCFAKNPNASGVVRIRFVIAPSGEVTSANVANSTLGNAEIEQCLVRRVLMMRFPAFEGSPKTVTFPFRFNP